MSKCLFFAADIISTVEFNHTGELLATGDKGGRVVIFQQEIEVKSCLSSVKFCSLSLATMFLKRSNMLLNYSEV